MKVLKASKELTKIFSSPIGESTFSTFNVDAKTEHEILFSSPIGESTFSTCNLFECVKYHANVFVPYRGIYFLYHDNKFSCKEWNSSFRPLSGNLLSLPKDDNSIGFRSVVFVPYRGIYFLYYILKSYRTIVAVFSSPIGESTFSTPASRTPLFIRVPELFCGAKFKNCFSISISYACAAFSLILCGAAQNSFYCRENSILPIPISYNFP